MLQLYLRLLSTIAGVLGQNVLEQYATLVITSHIIPVAPILRSSVHILTIKYIQCMYFFNVTLYRTVDSALVVVTYLVLKTKTKLDFRKNS